MKEESDLMTLFSEGKAKMSSGQENLIRVGQKPAMNYVVACVTMFNSGKPDVMLRARGQAINNAVEIVELLKKFQKNLTIKNIEIGSEDVTRPDGTKSSISTIEITIGKQAL